MNRTYTAGIFAIALTGYGAAAQAQQSCENDIEQLRDRLDSEQVRSTVAETVRQLLSRAETSDNCQALVMSAEQTLDAETGPEGERSAALAGSAESEARSSEPGARTNEPGSRSGDAVAQNQSQPRSGAQSTDQPESARSDAQGEAAEATQVRVDQAPAQVTVDAPAAQIRVEQQPAQVRVEQQPPDVEISQPEPQVTVNQAEPEVTVNQAEPNVRVNQAEPEVTVSQAEPEVRVVQDEPEADIAQDRAQADRQQAGDDAADRQLAAESDSDRVQPTRSADISEQEALELVGQEIESRTGEEIGEVAAIVQSDADGSYHAVAEIGGVLGVSEETRAIPFDELEFDPERNLVSLMSRNEIEQLPEYDESGYREIDASAAGAVR